jgi:signal transduction histidine kinase
MNRELEAHQPMSRLLAPLARPATYRALLFFVAQLALGIVAWVVLIGGWSVTAVLAITPLVIPLLVGLRWGVGLLARAQAEVARELLGTSTHPPIAIRGRGFWGWGAEVLTDRAFWRQQAHLMLAWPLALIPLALVSLAVQALLVPLSYSRWESDEVFGIRGIDTLGEALLFVPLGLAMLVAAAHLLGPMAALSRRLAAQLLAGDEVDRRSPAERSAARTRALTIHSLVSTSIVVVLALIWALTGGGYFWPVWPLLVLVFVVGIPGWIYLVLEHPAPRRLAGGSVLLAIQIGLSVLIVGFLVAVWAVTTHGYFWPVWPALGLALAAAIHAAVVHGRRGHRIEVLEASRAGAIDVQDAELRRIERDLHDGAQARLVALGMNLGMAEQKLQDDPEAVRELLAEARRGAGEALEELRDLARGIHPPILTDRGLEAALAALTARSPVHVRLSVDLPQRPAGTVESAAYFVVSEALANAIKHARATRVDVVIERSDGLLVAEVADDGRGGADPAGRGLTGLRQRVTALDGTLRITSPEGGPTTLRAELPCGS